MRIKYVIIANDDGDDALAPAQSGSLSGKRKHLQCASQPGQKGRATIEIETGITSCFPVFLFDTKTILCYDIDRII